MKGKIHVCCIWSSLGVLVPFTRRATQHQFYEDPLRLLINSRGRISYNFWMLKSATVVGRGHRSHTLLNLLFHSPTFLKRSSTTACCSFCFHCHPWPLILQYVPCQLPRNKTLLLQKKQRLDWIKSSCLTGNLTIVPLAPFRLNQTVIESLQISTPSSINRQLMKLKSPVFWSRKSGDWCCSVGDRERMRFKVCLVPFPPQLQRLGESNYSRIP